MTFTAATKCCVVEKLEGKDVNKKDPCDFRFSRLETLVTGIISFFGEFRPNKKPEDETPGGNVFLSLIFIITKLSIRNGIVENLSIPSKDEIENELNDLLMSM